MTEIETQIINAVITEAFHRGLTISVFDGEEYPVKRSRNRAAILAEVGATDETYLSLGENQGSFWLIPGNGEDIISDYTDNELCNSIFDEVIK